VEQTRSPPPLVSLSFERYCNIKDIRKISGRFIIVRTTSVLYSGYNILLSNPWLLFLYGLGPFLEEVVRLLVPSPVSLNGSACPPMNPVIRGLSTHIVFFAGSYYYVWLLSLSFFL
jgi:hypothetical protein